VPVFVLTVLKVVFLAFLYFFVYRAIRTIAIDLRGQPRASRRAETRSGPSMPRPAKARTKGRPPRSVVVLDTKGAKGQTLRLDGNLQVGRSEGCEIRVDDNYVSAFHARIFSRDGVWYVEDLGSTNGTYVNQRRVTSPILVHAGDRIRMGKSVLELRR
jgi:pSer/pThr/pTyr-binding forkhead associated (FHA) protein